MLKKIWACFVNKVIGRVRVFHGIAVGLVTGAKKQANGSK